MSGSKSCSTAAWWAEIDIYFSDVPCAMPTNTRALKSEAIVPSRWKRADVQHGIIFMPQSMESVVNINAHSKRCYRLLFHIQILSLRTLYALMLHALRLGLHIMHNSRVLTVFFAFRETFSACLKTFSNPQTCTQFRQARTNWYSPLLHAV